jgi:ABC-type transporter Mla subunit MlaD
MGRRLTFAMLMIFAVVLIGVSASCGGSGTKSPRSYTVTVSGSGGISSSIVVTVQ